MGSQGFGNSCGPSRFTGEGHSFPFSASVSVTASVAVSFLTSVSVTASVAVFFPRLRAASVRPTPAVTNAPAAAMTSATSAPVRARSLLMATAPETSVTLYSTVFRPSAEVTEMVTTSPSRLVSTVWPSVRSNTGVTIALATSGTDTLYPRFDGSKPSTSLPFTLMPCKVAS